MRILKFGGTSVGSEDAIQQVVNIISQKKSSDDQVHVVVSAFGGVTNTLQQIVEQAAVDKAYRGQLSEVEDRHIETVRKLIQVEEQSSVLTQLKILFIVN